MYNFQFLAILIGQESCTSVNVSFHSVQILYVTLRNSYSMQSSTFDCEKCKANFDNFEETVVDQLLGVRYILIRRSASLDFKHLFH